jgi:hypothetical protein
MSDEQSTNEDENSVNRSHDTATTKAEKAADAKAEELRLAAESKSEQGRSSLGSLPADEDKGSG